MQTLMVVLHIIVTLLLVLVILLQTGKGSAMGSGLGGGSSQTMFGSSGSSNFMTKLTTGLAIVFMLTSLTLATISSQEESRSIMEGVGQTQETVPAPRDTGAPETR